MQPGQHMVEPPLNCMFPWTIPADLTAEPDTTASDPPAAEEEAFEEKPVAFRAWCMEHAAELGDA